MTRSKTKTKPIKKSKRKAKVARESQPNADISHESRDKIILFFIETIIIGSLSFLIAQQYNTLRKFSDIRFEEQDLTSLQKETAGEIHKKFVIYKLGEEPAKDVTVDFGILRNYRQNYEIKDGSASVKEYDKGIFNILIKPTLNDARITRIPPDNDDPDYSMSNRYAFVLNELSPAYVYEFTVTVVKKNLDSANTNSENSMPFILQFQDRNDKEYSHKMERLDYIRIYINELLILAIMFLIIFALGIWKLNNRLLNTRKGKLP